MRLPLVLMLIGAVCILWMAAAQDPPLFEDRACDAQAERIQALAVHGVQGVARIYAYPSGQLVIRSGALGAHVAVPGLDHLNNGDVAVFDLLRGDGDFALECEFAEGSPRLVWHDPGARTTATVTFSIERQDDIDRLVLDIHYICGEAARVRDEPSVGFATAAGPVFFDPTGQLKCDDDIWQTRLFLPRDGDRDLDGLPDAEDPCHCTALHSGQQQHPNQDDDEWGDDCDRDRDGDLVPDVPRFGSACPAAGADAVDGEPAPRACWETQCYPGDRSEDPRLDAPVDIALDNCPDEQNNDQTDTDGDGVGDACDDDDDDDGVPDAQDDCPRFADDAIGDPCDADDDGDRVLDLVDNCPGVANAAQRDLDSDGLGDACDPDVDGDRVLDLVDNCDAVFNPSQRDADRDEVGDLCDPDDDNDEVDDASDACPTHPRATARAACLVDRDGDGRPNLKDPCVAVPHEPGRQACDDDDDDDGIADVCDLDCQWTGELALFEDCRSPLGAGAGHDPCCIGAAATARARDRAAFDMLCGIGQALLQDRPGAIRNPDDRAPTPILFQHRSLR